MSRLQAATLFAVVQLPEGEPQVSKIILALIALCLTAAPVALADNSKPQPPSKADFSGTGANQSGPYDSTRDGSPSGNGNGDGNANGKPCAGCVGKADNKNPQGQMPGGSDANNGYECDGNKGVSQGNPAHTSCQVTTTTPPVPPIAPPPPPALTLTPVPPTLVPPTAVPPTIVPPVTTPPTPPVTTTDFCQNIKGVQTTVPKGMTRKDGNCAKVQVKGKKKVAKIDRCKNIKGAQTKVPKGKVLKRGNCVQVAIKGKKQVRVPKPKALPYTP